MERYAKLIFAVVIVTSFVLVLAAGRQAQNPQSQDQSQQRQQAEKPPHVDTEPAPADRALEHAIMNEFKQDPHSAYSHVRVHVTDTEVLLSGVVLSNAAKDQAAQIATAHAGNRKVVNHIKVNPNIHPAPGM